MTTPQTSQVDRVLDALVEQEAVHYAVVTSRGGNTVAEAGDVPERTGGDSLEATVSGASGIGRCRVRMMVEVGEGKILHVGTTQRLPGPEVRQLRSVVASAL